MSVWRCEISVDNIIATPNPDPALTGIGGNPAFFTYVGFVIKDGVGNLWVCQYGVIYTDPMLGPVTFDSFVSVKPFGTAPFNVDGPDPFTWGFGVFEISLSTSGSGGYTGGGTLALVKDTAANTLTAITPIGTASAALATNDSIRLNSAVNDTPIVPVGFGLSFSVPQDGIHNPEATDSQAEFFNMRLLKDGIQQFNIPLSSAHPGTWFATAPQSFQDGPSTGDGFGGYNGISGSDPSVFKVESQLTTRYLIECQTSVVTYPSFATGDFWRFAARVPPFGNSLDMDLAPEHGIVWEGFPDIDDGSTMLVRRTFDNGHSWETWTVFQDDTNSDNSPTVSWYNGRLYVDWFNGTNMVQARSLDGGRHWDLPVTIPFTGTFPRRVVDRVGGGSFLFFFDTGDLKVVITYDGGATYQGPITVVSPATPQQIDAEFMPDGSLVVALVNNVGAIVQYRSRTLGRTWV
jgi:hypothetical protein